MCDQLRAFELGCYGHPVVRSPAIDGLARQGLRLEHAVSNCPVCMPARSVVLSGQYARTCCGSPTNRCNEFINGGASMPEYPRAGRPHLRDRTLPEQLRAAGYHTAAIGKWHIDSWPEDVGFDHYVIPRVHHCHSGQLFTENGGLEFSPPGYSVDYEAQRVAEYLRERAQSNQPFFLYYNISPPHMPVGDMPARYREMYDPRTVKLRPNADAARVANLEHWLRVYLWDYRYYELGLRSTQTLPPGFSLEQLTAYYWGAIAWVDDTVGTLLRALDEHQLTQDTLLVFCADHGDLLGSHGLMNKGTLHQESIRVPMLVRWPGQLQLGVDRDGIAGLVDLAPTLLELAGLEAPDTMQGRSLAERWRGSRADPANHTFIEAVHNGVGIATPTHTLGVPWANRPHDWSAGAAPHWLSCLREDPYELRNWVDEPAQAGVRADLLAHLQAWEAGSVR